MRLARTVLGRRATVSVLLVALAALLGWVLVWAHGSGTEDEYETGEGYSYVWTDVRQPSHQEHIVAGDWPHSFTGGMEYILRWKDGYPISERWHRAFRVRDSVGHVHEIYAATNEVYADANNPQSYAIEWKGDSLDLSDWGQVQAFANAWSDIKKDYPASALHQHVLYLNY